MVQPQTTFSTLFSRIRYCNYEEYIVLLVFLQPLSLVRTKIVRLPLGPYFDRHQK